MFTISKTFRFEAAHHLPNHDGKCRRVHGHSWIATVTVSANSVASDGAKRGMVLDFGDLKKIVQPVVDQYLDHWDLNETLDIYPTSENIAKWLYNIIAGKLDEYNDVEAFLSQELPQVTLVSVEINETCTSACTYTEE